MIVFGFSYPKCLGLFIPSPTVTFKPKKKKKRFIVTSLKLLLLFIKKL